MRRHLLSRGSVSVGSPAADEHPTPGDSRMRVPGVAALVDWIYAHRANAALSRNQVAAALLEFIEHVDALFANDPDWQRRKEYSMDDVRRELAAKPAPT
jgi:hypothetical protein